MTSAESRRSVLPPSSKRRTASGFPSVVISDHYRLRSEPGRCVEAAQQFVDAGFDRLVVQNAGPTSTASIDFYRSELDGRLTQLKPNSTRA
ncbi:hypothetical protein N7925_34270 [Streptomyces sp. CA-278952]|uniref:hypothetical protein n=1 Tax=unclassified Streptomyces TaxID=2593676 RepID=UPI00224264FA|nr:MULTISPECIES: hypothetical protein [unclassified Streptomyces]UZI33161.1 hypothetical protein OH133_36535 [Streptomyces sp. VB1]WDG33042.1 hypothetical protein N7925_34270 [Streptomyces sp. CA-278952]